VGAVCVLDAGSGFDRFIWLGKPCHDAGVWLRFSDHWHRSVGLRPGGMVESACGKCPGGYHGARSVRLVLRAVPIEHGITNVGKSMCAVDLGCGRRGGFASIFCFVGCCLSTGGDGRCFSLTDIDWLCHHHGFHSTQHAVAAHLGSPSGMAAIARAAVGSCGVAPTLVVATPDLK